MNNERLRSYGNSTRTSRLSNYSKRYFDFLDTHHSVFSRNSYYHDMRSIHPFDRRPCSQLSGIPFATLRAKCSSRLNELAKPKIKHERFIRQEYFDNINNCAYSGVQATALTAQCSDRLVILAQPKKKPIDYIDADKQGHISDRVSDITKSRHNMNSARKTKQK